MSLWKLMPKQVEQLYVQHPEVAFESNCTEQDLLKSLLDMLPNTSPFTIGPYGDVVGRKILVYYGTGVIWDPFSPLFTGRIETTCAGSRIVGSFRYGRFAQMFMAVWCCAILLISVLFVWTIFMPLMGLLMLWVTGGMIAFGDNLFPGRTERIIKHLCDICGGATPVKAFKTDKANKS
ncbi:MAG: hypothetical protein ACRCXD_05590 [Luteolibacter sp.]